MKNSLIVSKWRSNVKQTVYLKADNLNIRNNEHGMNLYRLQILIIKK